MVFSAHHLLPGQLFAKIDAEQAVQRAWRGCASLVIWAAIVTMFDVVDKTPYALSFSAVDKIALF